VFFLPDPLPRRVALFCVYSAPVLQASRRVRLFDVDKGEVRREQVVLVRGDRIEAVQPGSANLPAGARTIDLSG
jgi:imidazolonepropionase-like amidohydrolase